MSNYIPCFILIFKRYQLLTLIQPFFPDFNRVGRNSKIARLQKGRVNLLGTRILRISQITNTRSVDNSRAAVDLLTTIAAHTETTQNRSYDLSRHPRKCVKGRLLLARVRKLDKLAKQPRGAEGWL